MQFTKTKHNISVLILTSTAPTGFPTPTPHPHPWGRAGWACWGPAACSTWEDEMLPVSLRWEEITCGEVSKAHLPPTRHRERTVRPHRT